MKGKSIIAAVAVLALMGVTAVILNHAKSGQRLGPPGLKTRPIAGSSNLEVPSPR